jgi:hypothetical protein
MHFGRRTCVTMYNIGLFLLTHLAAGLVALVIDFFFYHDETQEVIDDFNQEGHPIILTKSTLNVLTILGGWYALVSCLKSIFDYYFEPDDEDE